MATKNSTASRSVVQLRLVKKDRISCDASQDVIEVLEVLLENARVGHITGIAFACTMYKSRYITNVVGHCQTNPTFALGMLATLSDELHQLVQLTDDDGQGFR